MLEDDNADCVGRQLECDNGIGLYINRRGNLESSQGLPPEVRLQHQGESTTSAVVAKDD